MVRRMLVLSTILLAASAYRARASRPEVVPVRESLSELPLQIGVWQGRRGPDFDDRVLAVLGVDDYTNRVYYGPDQSIAGLYIGYYRSQRDGDAIHSPLNCLPGAGWNPVKREHLSIPVGSSSRSEGIESGGAESIEVNRIVILKGMEKQVVLYWYQSHGRVVASEYWGKIYSVLDALRTNRTDAALIRVISPIGGLDGKSEAAAEKRAVDFAQALFSVLGRFLPA